MTVPPPHVTLTLTQAAERSPRPMQAGKLTCIPWALRFHVRQLHTCSMTVPWKGSRAHTKGQCSRTAGQHILGRFTSK